MPPIKALPTTPQKMAADLGQGAGERSARDLAGTEVTLLHQGFAPTRFGDQG